MKYCSMSGKHKTNESSPGVLDILTITTEKITQLKGVVDKILDAVAKFRGYFWTQEGRLP